MLNNEKRYVVWIVILTYQYIAMVTVTMIILTSLRGYSFETYSKMHNLLSKLEGYIIGMTETVSHTFLILNYPSAYCINTSIYHIISDAIY